MKIVAGILLLLSLGGCSNFSIYDKNAKAWCYWDYDDEYVCEDNNPHDRPNLGDDRF